MNIIHLVRYVLPLVMRNVRRSKLYVLYTYVYVNINKIILSLLYFLNNCNDLLMLNC